MNMRYQILSHMRRGKSKKKVRYIKKVLYK